LQEQGKEGKVNVIQGEKGWRTPEDTWMETEEADEVFFVNTLQAGSDSNKELEAEIAMTVKVIDDCFWSRAKRAGVAVDMSEVRFMSESERDCLSKKLGDGPGVRAKRRKEIEEMSEEDMGNKIKNTKEILRERARATGSWSRLRADWGACRLSWPSCAS
jgi:hypothetical protein